jgi:hypothetical protein
VADRITAAINDLARQPGDAMSPSPSVIVFDVNETLSDMSPMAGRFADIGAPEHLAKLWFATLLPARTRADAQRGLIPRTTAAGGGGG